MKFVASVILICFSALLARAEERGLDIYWIDVEGGASTLMVTPSGESVLVDTGNPGIRDPNRIMHVATQIAGLRRIDHLVTTHYHRDHYGGAALLSTLIPIGTVYDNGIFEDMPDNPGSAYFDLRCDHRVVIDPGDAIELEQLPNAPAMTIDCIGTRQTFVEPSAKSADNAQRCAECQPKERDGSDNANSVVLVVQFGEFRFFDGGDLTWNQEMKLVCPKDLVGPVDVYQVTHHGLDSSNNPVVLNTIEPRVAVMNNGETKGCLPEVFANLQATPSIEHIYQMHKNLRPDGAVNNVHDHFIANHESAADCKGNHIHLSVAADSSKYTVSVPSQGTQHSYATKKKKS